MVDEKNTSVLAQEQLYKYIMGYLVIYKKYQWQSKREYQRRESRRNLCMLEENNMEVTWKI